jgi:hypothetical protein
MWYIEINTAVTVDCNIYKLNLQSLDIVLEDHAYFLTAIKF